MTWNANLIDQGAQLRSRAEAQTLNVNEAHLLVHGVFARAFAGGRQREGNLNNALTQALELWTDRAA
ncbi:MAG: hypothetical protein NW206_12475 [Hyphomonadaceae bacterium]|nr:hypothetical protein [Hyphomonadaceae bacterium]